MKLKMSELIALAESLSEDKGKGLYDIPITNKSDELAEFIARLEGRLKENAIPLEQVKKLCKEAERLPNMPISNFERFIGNLRNL